MSGVEWFWYGVVGSSDRIKAEAPRRIVVSAWMAASATNEAAVACVVDLLPSVRSGVNVAIPYTRVQSGMPLDYLLGGRSVSTDVFRAEVYRSDGVLISTITIVRSGSTSVELLESKFASEQLTPCCVAQRSVGHLFALDTEQWLSRFEQALAIVVLDDTNPERSE